jgi:type IV secretion system protein VirB10
MASLLQKIKDKLFPKPDFDLEDDDIDNNSVNEVEEEIEDVEVDLKGPEISSAKKNKIFVVAASSLLITLVIYFLFIKDSNKARPKLETVAPTIRPKDVARSEDGRSPFELQDIRQNEDLSLLEKPKAPEIPKLPEVSDGLNKEDLILPQDLFIDVKPEQKQPKIEPEAPPVELPTPKINNEITQPPQQAQQTQQEQPKFKDPRYAPIIVLNGGAGPAQGVGYERNMQLLNGDPVSQLKKTQIGVEATFVEDRANVVAQGKMLNAVLETAINTEVPGAVRGVISRDVYGEAGGKVLIPRGSRLYGTYATDVTRGQARVRINWTRLIRPDGVSLNISSFASDQFGRAGIEGIVDNKYSQTITNTLLTSLLTIAGAAVVDLAVGDNNNTNTTTVNPNTGSSTITSRATTQAANDVTRNINDIASRYFNEYFDSRPTITVPQGTRITVLVNSDIKVPSVKR